MPDDLYKTMPWEVDAQPNPGLDNGNSGSFDWGGLVNAGIKGVGNYISNPSAIPSLAMATKAYLDAGKYKDATEAGMKEANPFGDQREFYKNKLRDLYADPSTLADSAAYKWRMSQGMGQTGGALSAAHGGYGNEFGAMEKYSQGLASTEFDNEVKRLSGLAGSQFGPETATQLRMSGLNNQLAAENAALGFLAQPFGNNQGPNGPGNGDPDYGKIVNGAIKAGSPAIDAVVKSIYAGGPGATKVLGDLINKGVKFITLPDGSQIDVEAAARMGGGSDSPGEYGTYPTEDAQKWWDEQNTPDPAPGPVDFTSPDMGGGMGVGDLSPDLINYWD